MAKEINSSMQINRINYEEFFLLYIDKELSIQEKNAVDEFVLNNPDLNEEFLMLKQSVLPIDTVVFNKKESLMVLEPLDNTTEEQLLLLLDNELMGDELKKTEQLIIDDKKVKREWDLLQKTKLVESDTIIFEEKHLLYKKEEGRVVAFSWWKIAVAALIIGGGLWGGIKYSSSNYDVHTIQNSTTVIKNHNQPSGAVSTSSNGSVNETSSATNKLINEQNTVSTNPPLKETTIGNEKNIAPKAPIALNESVIKDEIKENKKTNNLPKPLFENNLQDNSNKTDVATVSSLQKDRQETITTNQTDYRNSKNELSNSTIANNYITNATFVEHIATTGFFEDEEEDSKSRKTKLGGFLKKAKRILERKTKIKNGSNNDLQIANFSFAIQ